MGVGDGLGVSVCALQVAHHSRGSPSLLLTTASCSLSGIRGGRGDGGSASAKASDRHRRRPAAIASLTQLRVTIHRPHGPTASRHLLLKRRHTGKHLSPPTPNLLPARIQHAPSRACRARAAHPPARCSLLLRVSDTRLTSSIARRRMIAS